jgi:hypothetical protein
MALLDGATSAPEGGTAAQDGGTDDAGSLADRVAASAFPALGEQAGWYTVAQPVTAHRELWLVLAERSGPWPGKPPANVEAWPETHVALVQQIGDSVVPVAAAEVPREVAPCKEADGVLARRYILELDESLEALVPGEVILPLRVTCELSWMAAEVDDAYLILFRRDGSRLEDVLSVQTQHSDEDRIAHQRTGVFHTLTAEPSENRDRTRLCLREATPPSSAVRPAPGTHSQRRRPCYDWNGTRFVDVP